MLDSFLSQNDIPQHKSDPLCEILMNNGDISALQLEKTLVLQKKHPNMRVGEILLQLKIITEKTLVSALGQQLGLRCLFDENIKPQVQALNLIPAAYAIEHNVLPIKTDGHTLEVLISNPRDDELIHMLNFLTGKIIDPILSTHQIIHKIVLETYAIHDDDVLIEKFGSSLQEPISKDAILRIAEEKPTVQLVNNMILHAINKGASDIHIRPQEQTVELIFRIDGQLELQRNFPKSVLSAIASRIKVIGGMDITEHRIPQDGRIRMKTATVTIDMRISIMPSLYGDSIVIRLLDSTERLMTIESLGASSKDAENFIKCLDKGSGLILVTGPTGSGKSTTLYAGLQYIRDKNINIITLENPVEYRLRGVTQVQINEDVGYTFSRALRNILRHDPDAIMIGEMRDEETAKIAIESSLTGHLVLSTLHTNDAASAVTRLLEMGVHDYLIRSTLIASISQRLVRKNCQDCLVPEPINDKIAAEINVIPAATFQRGQGCKKCSQSGYKGRIAVYEFMLVNNYIKDMIEEGVSSDAIKEEAIKHGMRTLHKQAIDLAAKGLINIDQIRLIINS
jgi:type IV pilus assembly protein PilB